MSVAVPVGHGEAGRWSPAWRRHAAGLFATWAALLILFHRDVADVAEIWWNSTTFGHCLFVPPILGWLVWLRRRELAQVPVAGWWPGLAIVVGGGLLWLVGDAAAVALCRHFGLVAMMAGAVVVVLGRQAARALAFPLGYMIFLVPFGDFLEAPLQTFTVRMTMALLDVAGVPAQVDGVLITIPNGFFEVAEACSGAKFVIAMVAYGALVANVCYLRAERRAAFMAMALVVPVLANGLRAAGTIYAAYLTDVEAATGFDHIVYGWVFFAATMAVVLAIGWRWFDRDPDAAWFDPADFAAPPTARLDAGVACGAVLAIAVAFAGWASLIAHRSDALPERLQLPDVPGWRRGAADGEAWVPHYPGADHFLIGRFVDAGGRRVDLAVAVYARQGEAHELVGFGQGAIRQNDRWVRVEDLPPLDGGRALRMAAPGPVERETVTWYRVGDVTTGSEARVKLETLKAKLLGGRQTAVAVLVSAPRERQNAGAAIRAFVAAAGSVDAIAERVAAGGR